MSLAVVRCPACLGASGVEADVLGEMVACPRCQVPFVAVEEIVPTIQPAYRPKSARLVAPLERAVRDEESESLPSPDTPRIPDPEHDPHLPPVAGLPVSVLVGLSLLPFAIPLLWWAAPVVTGQRAALTLAVPISLAIAASTLGLGVVYTIDWSAATRVRGVLTLVALAYLTAAGLFFLKKEMLDSVRDFIEPQSRWNPVESRPGGFKVKVRGKAADTDERMLGMMMVGKKAAFMTRAEDEYRYLALGGTPDLPRKAAEEWYAAVRAQLAKDGDVNDDGAVKLSNGGHPGHQWTVKRDGALRIVQMYLIEGRIYYLSVEGRNASPADMDYTQPFFHSFEIAKAKR